MDTSDLMLIEKICELGSLTRAAEVLYLSQPTLSKKLGRLESQLGATLFHRSSTGLVPTDVARYIIVSAQPLKDQLRRIERHVEQITQLDRGDVQLGVGPIIEQVLLPTVLSKFVAQTGRVQMSVITEDADTLLQLLRSASVDVIAGPFRAADYDEKEFIAFPLVSDSFIAVARTGHPLFTSDDASIDFRSFPWAAPKPQGAVADQPNLDTTPHQRVVSDNYALLIKLTVSSDCICFGPEHIFQTEINGGTLAKIQGVPKLQWESACLVRPESVETPLVKLVADLLISASEDYRRTHDATAS